MTARNDFPAIVSDWLDERAGHSTPDYLDEILSRTSRTRQRPAWSSLERWLPVDLTVARRSFAWPVAGRTLIVIALLLALVGLAIAFAGSRTRLPAPFGPAANGAILSSADGDIFVSPADGNALRPLVAGETNDFGPWYSHDGTRLLFWREVTKSTSHVMMANADGSGIRTLTREPLAAADWYEWSPSDDRVAIVHGIAGRRVLSILDVASGDLRTLEVPGLHVDNNVLWRPPNGDELVFTARPEIEGSTGATVLAIRPDGTNLRTIRPSPSAEWPFLHLDLAPDGSTLSYWMYQLIQGQSQARARVHFVDLDTGQDRTVVFDPQAIDESELRFSPDGRTGAIVSQLDQVRLVVVPLDGSSPGRPIGPQIPASSDARVIAFSPDGQTLIFHMNGQRPQFIDVASGAVRMGAIELGAWSAWQRLAP